MTEKPAKPDLTRDQLQYLLELARETRTTEYALIRLVLTVSGGALALSIGFALGDRRVPIPPELVSYVRYAWLSLIVSMACALLAAAVTSLVLTIASKLIPQYIGVESFAAKLVVEIADYASTALAALAAVLGVAGLSFLAFVALQVVGK